ncbi:MAG: 6-bladed beta-propeller [Gemmatimonadetes bacterium]|nr:6-bladed beta-propeller [Gemmatimonadota bacterium]MYK67040.1 6-bladed beta-propeller [Gemmatimonadota bacterium]
MAMPAQGHCGKLTATLTLLLTACGSGSDSAANAIHNIDEPLWAPEEAWRVVEDLRIGSALSEGPDLFGAVYSFDVDAWGRIFVLDDQAQEVRIFDAGGAFVRTVGGRGEGPGEFTEAVSVDLSRNGEIWVMGMGEGRLSIFDTTGTYLRQERTNDGSWSVKPYPGGFDPMGRYNLLIRSGGTRFLARFDQSFAPIDTIPIPENPLELEFFETPSTSVAVPFQGSMRWRFSPAGTVWTLLTARYELTEMTTGGEVLRTVTKDHEPFPVSDEDREAAIADLEWFTSRGGQIDPAKFPGNIPATASFFIDDEGNLWVERRVADDDEGDAGRLFDIFEAEGRYLGTLRLPFGLAWSIPEPLVREGVLYGVTSDGAGVPYVVRGRIEKP